MEEEETSVSNKDDTDGPVRLPSVDNAVGKLRQRKRGKEKKPLKKLTKFERRYSELGTLLQPEVKRIDYVLIHPKEASTDHGISEGKRKSLEKKEKYREQFENCLRLQGFSISEVVVTRHDGQFVFKKLHCPFKRLCAEAERVKLEMPLKDCPNYPPARMNCLTQWVEDKFDPDKDEVDYISAPFLMDKIHLFEDYENPTKFFRPALRGLLTHHILINSDIRDKVTIEGKVLKKQGLKYLLMKEVYSDAFTLHEESILSKRKEEPLDKDSPDPVLTAEEERKEELANDPRKVLDEQWISFWKFQPLWKIRNYFGEKIAMYFGWAGMLMTSLWLPTIFGLAVFIYGLVLSIDKQINLDTSVPDNATDSEEIRIAVNRLLDTIRAAFDNDVTPWFALVICLWGTVFLEYWKRYNARLAYEWDVDNYEANEPDRPQFFGTKVKKDPVTQDDNWFYPFKRQLVKFFFSGMTLLCMVCFVLISVAGVIVYRVIISVDYCPGKSAVSCLISSTIISSLLNAISIIILGKLYEIVAIKLTDWENHRTQTQYDDALIIKLFAFNFANSYASCFYIAFFRGRYDAFGVFGLGEEYSDTCKGGSCMSQLSFQVLILMLVRPFPRLFKDLIVPFIKWLWRNRPQCCRSKCCKNQVDEEDPTLDMTPSLKAHHDFLEKESIKQILSQPDFTLNEYNEKIIQYGFLMLFAASFPLAPLLAILILLIDIRVDAKRLLWFNRRPIALIAQDIGVWYNILNLVNIIGVVTNGFLIAFTSSWGSQYDITSQLWICLGFEHIVFALKFMLAYLIPDVPRDVRLAIRREKYQVGLKMHADEEKKKLDFTELFPSFTLDRKSRKASANYAAFDEPVDNVTPPQELPSLKEEEETAVEEDNKEERIKHSGRIYECLPHTESVTSLMSGISEPYEYIEPDRQVLEPEITPDSARTFASNPISVSQIDTEGKELDRHNSTEKLLPAVEKSPESKPKRKRRGKTGTDNIDGNEVDPYTVVTEKDMEMHATVDDVNDDETKC